ncbi:MAG: PoNe immunity protein domain-containing protein [Coprococcus sp.]
MSLIHRKYPFLVHTKLVKSINDEDRDAFLKYLRGWYKGSVDSAWYGTHELVNKYQYYGYWCFEAGAIAKRLGFIDDDLKMSNIIHMIWFISYNDS